MSWGCASICHCVPDRPLGSRSLGQQCHKAFNIAPASPNHGSPSTAITQECFSALPSDLSDFQRSPLCLPTAELQRRHSRSRLDFMILQPRAAPLQGERSPRSTQLGPPVSCVHPAAAAPGAGWKWVKLGALVPSSGACRRAGAATARPCGRVSSASVLNSSLPPTRFPWIGVKSGFGSVSAHAQRLGERRTRLWSQRRGWRQRGWAVLQRRDIILTKKQKNQKV